MAAKPGIMNLNEYGITNHSFFGLKVTSFEPADLERLLIDAVRQGEGLTAYGYSLTLLPRFRTMPQIYPIAESCDIMVADGKGLYHLCRWFGVPLRSDWAIYELTDKLLELADRERFSVLLLGADADSNRRAGENLAQRYPGARILDGINGFYDVSREHEVVNSINERNPDILMVGMSSPKKEEFLSRQQRNLKARVIVLIGGVIDIYAGNTSTIPRWVKRLCLTWVYRVLQEPVRTRHILLNGLKVLFGLLPALMWRVVICRNKAFSIPAFYGILST